MDGAFRTPLLDLFRRGEVTRDIRLLAARGALTPRAHEQVSLLVLLAGDQDPEVAAAAEASLSAVNPAVLAAFLARSDAPSEIRAFFAARGIVPGDTPLPDAETPILDSASDEEATPMETSSAGATDGSDTGTATANEPDGKDVSTLQKIAALNVAQRMALAMKGTREERAVLIRDPNKLVGVSVLSSPKLTDTEVESIARMSNISDELLRIIAHTRAWTKNYSVVLALAKNPKTPVALSMNFLARLNDRDLRMLSTDRNVPDVLRITARKKIVIEK